MRSTLTQPTYNFFTGEMLTSTNTSQDHASRPRAGAAVSGPSPPRNQRGGTVGTTGSRESSKENQAPPDAAENETQRRRIEELKAEVGTLRYTISSAEQEAELLRLRTEGELRDARRRAEEDFAARQAAEADKTRAQRLAASLQEGLDTLRADKDGQKRELEAKARDALDEGRLLKEQLEDLTAAKEESARLSQREVTDLKDKVAAVQRTVQEREQEARARDALVEQAQSALSEKNKTICTMEAEMLRLKATTGDAETVAVIRRELTDQVKHIRRLEAMNREQDAELSQLRQIHKATEIVEEEKRSLQRKLEAAEALQAELAEERRRRQMLEDERRAWSAYLQTECQSDGPVELDSPEAVARALVQERIHSASLVDKLGQLQPEVTVRENVINALEHEKASLVMQIEALKTSGAPAGVANSVDKAYKRLDRQRELAVQEAAYLRAQLKTYEDEEMTFNTEQLDERKANRILELEKLVDASRGELQTVLGEFEARDLSFAAGGCSVTTVAPAGLKRPRDGDDQGQSEQLGQLMGKKRKLQSDFSELQSQYQLLQKEHAVATEQLAAAKSQLSTRVLALRSNPTADHATVKQATLDALRRENADLLAHIQKHGGVATVPASQLVAAQRAVDEARTETASARKSARRLKEVWAAKSADFKEAVFSTLGWTVTFLPGDKMRVESVYQPSQTDEHENSIVFDGGKGTMKVGGGPSSAFAQRIGNNIKFWVRERGCVPCFLAALTLEFYDEHTRAGMKASD